MKRRVVYVLAFGLFFCALAAVAKDTATQPSKPQPIGIFTSDDGKTILVGIGTTKPLATLDVSRGEVKVGSTGAVCTKQIAGTIRYANSKLQLCDGAGWRNVSLDKGQ